MKKPIQTRLPYLRFVLPFLVLISLVACSVGTETRLINYKGTCSQQTQQFMDYVHSLAVDELNPLIVDGYQSGPTTDFMKRIDALNTKINDINTPECNPRAEGVKDALILYMRETKSYFTVMLGRAAYGEGSVQAQFAKMSEAAQAFEITLEDLRK